MLKKILIISTNADEAGAPRHVEVIINGLESAFQFISVFGEEGPVSDRLRCHGHIVHVIKEMRTAINPIKDILALIKIARLIIKYQPDIIHCHSTKAGLLGRLCAFIFKKKWLYTVHGWGWRGFGSFTKRLIILVEIILSKLPNGFYIFVAKDVMNDALNIVGINPKKGVVIYNGVSPIRPELSEINAQLVVLMPARVCSAKDHQSLFLAFESINDPSIKLLLCGMGTDRAEFIDFARMQAPSMHESISFLGQRSDMDYIYAQCHVVALISNFEASPLSIIEAMSCARTVVATSVGGIPELIQNGVNGILVKLNCVEDIVQAFNRCRNEKFRARIGSNAKKTYEDFFTEKSMLKSIAQTYCYLSGASQWPN